MGAYQLWNENLDLPAKPDLTDPKSKVCSKCKADCLQIVFLKQSNGFYQFKGLCIDCGTKSEAIWHKKSPKKFYESHQWLELRYEVLTKYGFTCMACGRDKGDGIKLHVDHIKPRSKYPDLELDINNLQVLCEDCNIGKSNRYEDDFR